MPVDIIILPVTNAMTQVLTLYDKLAKQLIPDVTLTIINNGSTDGLSPLSLVTDESILYVESNQKIKNTAFLVNHAILNIHSPNDYILFLSSNSIVPDNFIENITDNIKALSEYHPDILLGPVGSLVKRTTKVTPDPRVKEYQKWEKELQSHTPSTSTDAETDITFTKISGNRTTNPENERKTESEVGKLKAEKKLRIDDISIEALPSNWSGIDLNINKELHEINVKKLKLLQGIVPDTQNDIKAIADDEEEKKLGKKQDSIEKPRVPDKGRLLEPSSTKPKTGFEKYDVVKDAKESVSPTTHSEVPPRTEKTTKIATVSPTTHFFSSENWKNGFICNNILIRRKMLLQNGLFNRNSNISDALIEFCWISSNFTQCELDFSAEFPIHVRYAKKVKKYPVSKVTDRLSALYKALLEKRHAETDTETQKMSEKSRRQIIPDSFIQADTTSAYIYKNYLNNRVYRLPLHEIISSTLCVGIHAVIQNENIFAMSESSRSIDDDIFESSYDNMRELYRQFRHYNKSICIFINPLSEFNYSYFLEDFKRYYREDSVIVASNDFDFTELHADIIERENLSFCCNIKKLENFDCDLLTWMLHVEKSIPTIRDYVKDKISRISVGRGTAGVRLQDSRVQHREDWYEWMEDDED